MKKLALIMAMAFTLGLAASTVSASTKDDTKKAKTECCAKDKKECSAKDKKECCKEKKACCKKDSKAETK